MRALPSSKQEWLRFLLFVFKAYPVIATIGLLLWERPLYKQQFYGWLPEVVPAILLGILISAAFLVVGGITQLAVGQKKAAVSSFCFAAGSFAALFLLVPMFVKA
jgi:hypothetical protein